MTEKPPSYQWYPRDFMADPAVQAMTWEQRGRYRWALDCSWACESYGVAPENEWRKWMRYSPEEWATERLVYRPCFKVSARGVWTQKRLVMSRRGQVRNHDKAVKGGEETQRRRRTSLTALDSGSSSAPTLASASASAFRSYSDQPLTPILPRLAIGERSEPIASNLKSEPETETFPCQKCHAEGIRYVGDPRELCVECLSRAEDAS